MGCGVAEWAGAWMSLVSGEWGTKSRSVSCSGPPGPDSLPWWILDMEPTLGVVGRGPLPRKRGPVRHSRPPPPFPHRMATQTVVGLWGVHGTDSLRGGVVRG